MKYPFLDFKTVNPVPDDLVERFRGRVEDAIIEMWQTYGFGTAFKGFLKVINPEEFMTKLEHVLPREDLIPLFATGMGDLIVWDGNGYTSMIMRKGFHQALGRELKHVTLYLAHKDVYSDAFEPGSENNELLEDVFVWSPYPEAVAEYGEPAYDECFGYTPLLVLGGPQKVENLKKVKLIEHIALITDFAGVIPYWR